MTIENLGYKVTTRNYSWEAMVIAEWGDQWMQRVWNVKFSNGRKFVDTDNTKQGIYGVIVPMDRLLLDPVEAAQYFDMYKPGISLDPVTNLSPGNSGALEQG